MSEGLSKKLNEAVETGEIISVIYHGGSQPGTVRQISPLKVTHREIRAREVATGAVKTFLIDKMELAQGKSDAKQYNPDAVNKLPEPSTIQEVFQSEVEGLKRLGWYIQLEINSISLHRYFKNGKPRKGADVGITKYEDNPSRPYYVYGPSLATARTFGKLSKAIRLFSEEANTYAPKKST